MVFELLWDEAAFDSISDFVSSRIAPCIPPRRNISISPPSAFINFIFSRRSLLDAEITRYPLHTDQGQSDPVLPAVGSMIVEPGRSLPFCPHPESFQRGAVFTEPPGLKPSSLA